MDSKTTRHIISRPVQRQNARRHIIRIANAYRRNHAGNRVDGPSVYVPGRFFRGRVEVLGAFSAHMVSSRKRLIDRAEG